MNLYKTLTIAALAAVLIPAARAEDAPVLKDVVGTFDVVISRRGDPKAEPLALLGTMRFKVATNGSFTGTLVRTMGPSGSTFPAVVFRGSP